MESRLSRRRLFGLFAVAPVVALVPASPLGREESYRQLIAYIQDAPLKLPFLDPINLRRQRAIDAINAAGRNRARG